MSPVVVIVSSATMAAPVSYDKSFEFIAVAGVLLSIFFTLMAVLAGALLRSYLRDDRKKHARWMTESSIFWSRWSLETVWTAPYPELTAEAARCNALITYLDAQRSAAWKKRSVAVDWRLEYFNAQINSYSALLAATQNVLRHTAPTGPHQPPYRP